MVSSHSFSPHTWSPPLTILFVVLITDLTRDGFAVVKGAVPRDRCEQYVSDIHEWLESFGLGYNRNDLSTVKEECLPIIHQKGLIQAYGAPHEVFTWAVRSEPGVIDTFAKIFNTEDLIVSFDAVNVSLANRKDLPENKGWAHQDQGELHVLHQPSSVIA